MGREKARKPRKDKNRRIPLSQLSSLLIEYDPDELWALLTAAGASPGVRHRWATIGHLTNAALRLTRAGTRRAKAADLQSLVDAAILDAPELAMMEDFMPEDPSGRPAVEFHGRVYSLFPGNVERPVADLDRALLLQSALDDLLIPRLGFGFAHIASVFLQHVDSSMETLGNAWSESTFEIGDQTVQLTEEELDAARQWLVQEEEFIPPLPQSALDWITTTATGLPYDAASPSSQFGRFMRVKLHDDRVRWLPLAYLPETFSHGVAELARTARPAIDANYRVAKEVARIVRRKLWRFVPEVIGSPDGVDGPAVSPRNVVQWAALYGESQIVAVQVLTILGDKGSVWSTPAALKAAHDAATGSNDVRVEFPAGGLTVRAGGEVVPLMVVAGAGHIFAPSGPGMVNMSLEDFTWISTTASSDTDLYNFCREMARTDLPEFIAWETINIWEWWKANGKSFFRGGRAPSVLAFESHAGSREWDRSVHLSELERALLRLGLPPVRDWDAVERGNKAPFTLTRWPLVEKGEFQPEWALGRHSRPVPWVQNLHLSTVPVAITAPLSQVLDDLAASLLFDLAGAFGFGFQAVDEVWSKLAENSPILGLRIELMAVVAEEESRPPIRVASYTAEPLAAGIAGAAILHVDSARLGAIGDGKPLVVREAMGAVVGDIATAAGYEPVLVRALVDAWLAAPPNLTIKSYEPITSRNHLPPPVPIDDALVSEVDRLIAEKLHSDGIAIGTYRGDDAKHLDRTSLAPSALGILTSRLSVYEAKHVLKFAASQLERILDRRTTILRDISQSNGVLTTAWDPVQRHSALDAEYLVLRRSTELIIESCLRDMPEGRGHLDEIGWGSLLAAARAYLDAAGRSENVHNQVTRTSIHISENYEISTLRDEQSESLYDLNAEAFDLARTSAHLQPESADDGQDDEADRLQGVVDEALKSAFGASGLDHMTMLASLARWQIETPHEVVTATRTEMIDWVLESTTLGDSSDGEERVAAVIEEITSAPGDYSLDDWKPWLLRTRRSRLLIRPLINVAPDEFLIAPHFCHAAMKLYGGYLFQGQLPWTQPVPPTVVETALAAVRSHRNTQLEKQVAVSLRSGGWTVIERIKVGDGNRLGVPLLSSEVDAVAGRPGSPTIWLLEVKDPADVFSVPEIRRSLDRFYSDSKKTTSYATMLQRKFEETAPFAAEIAASLGLPPRPAQDPYVVHAMFVTRGPVAAAFVGGRFAFATLETLVGVIDGDWPRS